LFEKKYSIIKLAVNQP